MKGFDLVEWIDAEDKMLEAVEPLSDFANEWFNRGHKGKISYYHNSDLISSDKEYIYFTFEDPDEATLFKLRWG